MRGSTVAIPVLLLAAFVAGGYLWHLGDIRSGAVPVETGEATVGGPFALIDQNGATRRDTDYRGKFMIVFFGYTECPDVCPTTLSELSAALDRLGPKADRVVPIFITVDPARDTPAVMKSYLAAFGARFVGLTGSAADIKAAAAAYHVYYRKRPMPGGSYSMDHSSVIYLMGPEGRYLTHYAIEQGPDAIAADLEKRI